MSSNIRKFNLQRHLKVQHGKDGSAITGQFMSCAVMFKGIFSCKQVDRSLQGTQNGNLWVLIYLIGMLAVMILHVVIGTTSKEFLSWETFLSWKQAEEEEASHTCFVQPPGESKCNSRESGGVFSLKLVIITLFIEFRSLFYTCCRDGKARENKCPRKTEEKRKITKKSRKLEGSYCLARMHVKHGDIHFDTYQSFTWIGRM